MTVLFRPAKPTFAELFPHPEMRPLYLALGHLQFLSVATVLKPAIHFKLLASRMNANMLDNADKQ